LGICSRTATFEFNIVSVNPRNKNLKLKRILTALILFAFLFSNVNSQISINGSIGVALPLGTFSNATTVGFGGSIGGQYQINPKMRAGVSFGYYGFISPETKMVNETDQMPGWSIYNISGTYNYTYYSYKDFSFLAGSDLSLYLCRIRVIGSSYEANFGLAPYAGVMYNLNDWVKLTGNLKYNLIFTSSPIMYLGINLGSEMPFDKIIGIFTGKSK